jgi:tRNA uridine 5-carboxymethylaminomethyl modification enzyme
MLAEKGEPPCPNGARLADLLRRPRLGYDDLAPFDRERPPLGRDVTEQVEITVKYQGYIERQQRQVAEMARLESRPLPADVDYLSIQGLRLEARQKLDKIRPLNLGQASRISGVSPADVTALMIFLEK